MTAPTQTKLCFVDTETTGLNPRFHDAYELCLWHEEAAEPVTVRLEHSIMDADPQALAIGRYFEREWSRNSRPTAYPEDVARELRGVTLVGCNPAFDAAMIQKYTGIQTWHYRLIDIADGAMWLFGWDRPKGLHEIVAALNAEGYVIPEPDHTATADVRATRAAYLALRHKAEG